MQSRWAGNGLGEKVPEASLVHRDITELEIPLREALGRTKECAPPALPRGFWSVEAPDDEGACIVVLNGVACHEHEHVKVTVASLQH